MSVPPQMMAPGAGAPPGMPPGGGPPGAAPPAPAAAPMMNPQEPKGQQEGSRVDIMMATKLLERALGSFGATSKEGKSILKALSGLAAEFGKSEDNTQELMPAELKHMIAAAAGPGTPGGSGAGAPPPGGGPPG